ncbi:MAG: NUDIX hydrolase [Herbinix sp.]|nr:NUDIX hydrolase [Herbinix sp.]
MEKKDFLFNNEDNAYILNNFIGYEYDPSCTEDEPIVVSVSPEYGKLINKVADKSNLKKLMNKSAPILADTRELGVVSKNRVEGLIAYKQIGVGLFLINNDRVLLLPRNDITYDPVYSFPMGHCSANENMIKKSACDYLLTEAKREFFEELTTTPVERSKIRALTRDIGEPNVVFIDYETGNVREITHCGFVFIFNIDDQTFNNIEGLNSEVKSCSINKPELNVCNWTRDVIEHLKYGSVYSSINV